MLCPLLIFSPFIPVTMNTHLASRYCFVMQFPTRRNQVPWKKSWFWPWDKELQGKSGTSYAREWGSTERSLETCQKDRHWFKRISTGKIWVLKNWCFWTVVLEKTFESPMDCKEIPVNPKGNQSRIFIGRTDAEAETPILWPPDVTRWLIRRDPDAEKDWRQEEKGATEDEMVGWHHWLYGHEFE